MEAKDYIGERLDEETGLLYLNARYYDPVLGRFISGDPSSPVKHGVGVNRYAYALNNPIFYSDPYGLDAESNTIARAYESALQKAIESMGHIDVPGLSPKELEAAQRKLRSSTLENFLGDKTVDPQFKEDFVKGLARRDKLGIGNRFDEFPEEYQDLYADTYNSAPGVEDALAAIAALRGVKGAATPGAVTAAGQLHHVISRTVHRALERHPNLAGKYAARDPRLTAQAANQKAHTGYQDWHRKVDAEVSEWLDRNPQATPKQFEDYLRDRYSRPDLLDRFPGGIQ